MGVGRCHGISGGKSQCSGASAQWVESGWKESSAVLIEQPAGTLFAVRVLVPSKRQGAPALIVWMSEISDVSLKLFFASRWKTSFRCCENQAWHLLLAYQIQLGSKRFQCE